MEERKNRKSPRLKEYDYTKSGAYFVTIVTEKRKQLLSEIIVGEGLAPPSVKLTEIGNVCERELLCLEKRYSSVKIAKYVIMPNHVHALIELEGGASPSPTLIDVVRVFKSLSTRMSGLGTLWQRSFYDHVIRCEADYLNVWNYIDGNPSKWLEDEYYV